ncbi:hypothetical protein [Desulfoferula mesophila]
MTLAVLFLFAYLAQASGGKNQGDIGQGDPDPSRDPMPIDWPGIDW